MPLNQFIINDIRPFEVKTTIAELQEVFNQLTYSHVPIQKDGVYMGCLSVTDVYCFEANQKVNDILYAVEGFFVIEHTIWLDVLDRFAGNDANIMLNITGGNPWKDCGIAEFEQPGPCQEPYLYDWDIDGLGDMDDDLHLFYLNPGNYFITVYDSLTCRDTATITIENSFEIFVPSAITPNNDGYNDTWDIRGIIISQLLLF